ncbi:venom serine protease-like [Neocloeon triangulifer]|uniref:venom serine protease-like n=1 Tax=Neocloeon triangulifer TaxID=2078957 RepID=UPI00286F634E|nr:venom serine protease-like [Neocloeon triangulifer]
MINLVTVFLFSAPAVILGAALSGDFPRAHMRLEPFKNDTGRIVTSLLMLLGIKSNSTASTEDDRAQVSNRITPGCDFYQNVEPGDKFYIYSPNYPDTFGPHLTCRWYAVAPVGWRLELECREIQLDDGEFGDESCEGGDVLWVSLSGDSRLRDAHGYCGVGSFLTLSNSNLLNIVFQAGARYNPGSRFFCELRIRPADSVSTVAPPVVTSRPQPSCLCGRRFVNRIVGGSETGINEFPMMAGLVDLDSAKVICGATIISARRAITAAHCLVQRAPSSAVLLVGDHDLSTGTDTNKAAVFRIQRFIAFPQYNTVTQKNDIAIIETIRDMPFNVAVSPACLPFRFEEEEFVNEDVIVLGWGNTAYNGEPSSRLKKVELGVVSDEMCRSAYPSGNNIDNTQICTFKNGSDACQADSGGPVLWTDPETRRLHLVGIISYGFRCATHAPGVNTRVSKYLDWIQQVTGDDFCVAK